MAVYLLTKGAKGIHQVNAKGSTDTILCSNGVSERPYQTLELFKQGVALSRVVDGVMMPS